MEDLSLHILDVVENSVEAGATEINIRVSEDPARDRLELEIEDNGRGMDRETAARALSPFHTTRTTRRVGLGLPLLAQAAREAGGDIEISSEVGRGTKVTAWFRHGHIDRKPVGDIAATLATLVAGHPEIHFTYEHRDGESDFRLDTDEMRRTPTRGGTNER
ncbi:ATP-binding protein [candidate division WOR-3 bacterium]|nr:ATP-binding protein [candidate division WOR-3 bacterium]